MVQVQAKENTAVIVVHDGVGWALIIFFASVSSHVRGGTTGSV